MKKVSLILSIIFITIFITTGCSSLGKNIENENANITETNKIEETINLDLANFNIVSKDVNTSETIVLGSISVNNKSSIEEKLKSVIKEVSKLQFENAPIELVKVENNIAYIDIKEGEDQNYWSQRFFQGSTGASISSYALVENLLQRDYEGEWIDGIYISYEGKTDVEFDHLDMYFFGNIIKR
ncbi:MAG: hypothetical protein ACRCYC_02890 [Paraclostridium sp.]|uniref:hypothetical protein n=1 Tax=Paraclostridium sp. TaxID=2023273 RepID=UPI003F340192